MDKAFLDLRTSFEDPPNADNVEREANLNALVNVFLLYLMMKLFREQVLMADFVLRFDGDGDGNLEGFELTHLINEIEGLALTAAHVAEIQAALDSTGDGLISPEEFERQARVVERFCGQPGSPWKTYVDPAEGVLCYHHLQSGEQVFDFEMTDAKLREINELNLVAAADMEARVECHRLRDEAWRTAVRTFATRKLQKLYWDWKERKYLGDLRFKLRRKLWAREASGEEKAASRIAAVVKGRNERKKVIRKVVAKAFAKKKVKAGPNKGRVYYEQVNTKETYDHRPYLHRRYFPKIDW